MENLSKKAINLIESFDKKDHVKSLKNIKLLSKLDIVQMLDYFRRFRKSDLTHFIDMLIVLLE